MELKYLCDLNGVSGNERLVRNVLMEEAKKYADEVKIDRMGNLIAFKKGTDSENHPHVCLSAHMDEVGFIVLGATDDGLLRFTCVGGIDPRVIVSKYVVIGEEKVKGVIGAMAIHLQSHEMRARVLGYNELFIDIGAKTKDEALGKCPAGSYVAFDSTFEPLGDLVVAKALDDRVGCYNLLRLMQERYACDVSYAFVVQEEVGLRGAKCAGYGVQPDIAIVLEATTAADMGAVPTVRQVCNVNKGVVVSFMDTASIANKDLFHQMLSLAKENEITHQVKRGTFGGNDAGAYQRSTQGVRTITLSIPCRYIHGPSSVASLNDVDAQFALATAYLKSF